MPSPPREAASRSQPASPLAPSRPPTPRQFFSTSPPKPNPSGSSTLPRDFRYVCPCFLEARRLNQYPERHNQNSAQRFFPSWRSKFLSAEKLFTAREQTTKVFPSKKHLKKKRARILPKARCLQILTSLIQRFVTSFFMRSPLSLAKAPRPLPLCPAQPECRNS
jgi:hypothetical protein